jgi:hypothetical protein
MRTTIRAAGLLLTAGLLAGCGGDSAPADASEADFCEGYGNLFTKLADMDPEDPSTGIRAMKEWASDMEEVGTPEDMPDDAREGFETMLEQIGQIDEDATQKELEELGEDMSKGDQKSGAAFGAYAMKTCPDAMKGMLGDLEEQMGELEDLTESPSS